LLQPILLQKLWVTLVDDKNHIPLLKTKLLSKHHFKKHDKDGFFRMFFILRFKNCLFQSEKIKAVKKLIPVFLVISSFLYALPGQAQGMLQSVVPSQALQGQMVQLVIKGENTTFQTGNVTVDLGPDITITQIDVRTSATLFVSAEIAPNAQTGMRDVMVMSQGTSVFLPNGFEVLPNSANAVVALLEINPVQVLYASDFDPDNLAGAPVLFRVTVLNDQNVHTLKTYFQLFLEGEGLVLTAIKSHGEVQPNALLTFDNRDFDEFDFNQDKREVAAQIFSTGILPPGRYTYRIEVREGNNVLAETDAQITLLNQSGDVTLITPGTAIDEGYAPAVEIAAQPVFQWISSANQFDLFLYEVADGERNTQAIVQQLPVFREFNIAGNAFVYPLSAEPLQQGKTYAWQLRAYFNNATGNGYFDSPLFWFTYNATQTGTLLIGSIEIIPEILDMETNAFYRFDVIVKDIEGNILDVKPSWTVLPDESFGTITADGAFKAGKNPRMGAVQATYGDHSTHCLINLEFDGFEFQILDLIFRNATRKVYTPNAP
jgi:hypothetical protein